MRHGDWTSAVSPGGCVRKESVGGEGVVTTLLYDTYLITKDMGPMFTSTSGMMALKTSLASTRGRAVVGCFGMDSSRIRIVAVAGRSRRGRLSGVTPRSRVNSEALDYTCIGPARSNKVGIHATGLG